MKTITLKAGIKALWPDAENIKIRKNHTDFTGFFTAGGKTYYISHTPGYSVNLDAAGVMYREAQNYHDYKGLQNTWDFSRRLAALELKVKPLVG